MLPDTLVVVPHPGSSVELFIHCAWVVVAGVLGWFARGAKK